MIQMYRSFLGTEKIQELESGCWIHCVQPDSEEVNILQEEYKVPQDVIQDILDAYSTMALPGTPRELMEHIVHDGARTCEPPTITESRDRCRYALMHLDPTIRRFLNPQTYPVGLELGLAKFRGKLAQEERSGSGRN